MQVKGQYGRATFWSFLCEEKWSTRCLDQGPCSWWTLHIPGLEDVNLVKIDVAKDRIIRSGVGDPGIGKDSFRSIGVRSDCPQVPWRQRSSDWTIVDNQIVWLGREWLVRAQAGEFNPFHCLQGSLKK